MTSSYNQKILINILPFLLGIFSSFSLPPYNFLIINFLTFPILLLIILEQKKSKWVFFKIGWLFGFGYFLSNLYWITYSLTFEEIFKPLIPFTLIFIPLFLGLFYGIVTFIFSFFNPKRNFSTIIIFVIIFSIIEFLRGLIFGGFPWNLIVYSWTNYLDSLQTLSFIGTYSFNLISITIFTLPVVLFYKIKIIIKIYFVIFLFFILISNHLFGSLIIKSTNDSFEKELNFTIKIVSPQIKIDRYFSNENPEKILNELIDLSKPNSLKDEIFIFPEGVLSGIYFEDLKKYEKIFSENYSNNDILITGITSKEFIKDELKFFNSLVVIDNKTNLLNKYNKIKLVPFGEFLPFENFFKKFGLKKISFGYQSFSPGYEKNLINIKKKKFSFIPLICYEIIYSGNIKKSYENIDFIINISEDGWFGDSIGPYQHFSHSIFRSIEEGKNLIRVANSGISAFINPNGEVLYKLKSTEKGVIEIKKFNKSKKTLFSVYGNKIFLYFLLFYISLFFFIKRREIK